MALMQIFGQLLPLLVFIIVDSICNNIRVSIVSAILFAAGQLSLYYLKTGKFDWFVLVDVALIAALGTISIVSKNEMFFKVKPAIIEGATVVFMMVMFFLPDSVLLGYFGRMMPKDITLNPAAIDLMKTMLLWICAYILVHIGAILYTAFFCSRRMWAIVSGPGFYLLFIPIMIGLILKRIKIQHRR